MIMAMMLAVVTRDGEDLWFLCGDDDACGDDGLVSEGLVLF